MHRFRAVSRRHLSLNRPHILLSYSMKGKPPYLKNGQTRTGTHHTCRGLIIFSHFNQAYHLYSLQPRCHRHHRLEIQAIGVMFVQSAVISLKASRVGKVNTAALHNNFVEALKFTTDHIEAIHKKNRRFTCSACGDTFLWKQSRDRHKRSRCPTIKAHSGT